MIHGIISSTPRRVFSPGQRLKLTSPVFLSETNFIKLTFYGNIYHEITKGLVLAASLRGGGAQGLFQDERTPDSREVFPRRKDYGEGLCPGRTLVRKELTGILPAGTRFSWKTLNLRTSLGKNFGLVTFLDGGNVWVKMNEMKLDRFQVCRRPRVKIQYAGWPGPY